MKKLYIIANWKSNKTIDEAEAWMHTFQKALENIDVTNKEVIICPPFTALEHVRYCSSNLKLTIKLGAQDVSPFEEGAYTGEVSAQQIKELADYVLIGHSERRQLFESDEMFEKKVMMANRYDLIPIFFIQDKDTRVPKGVGIVVYEPPSSISPGIPDTPQNANAVASHVKKEIGVQHVLYGGNVTSENVNSFVSMSEINGVVVGRASLDPIEFSKIIQNA